MAFTCYPDDGNLHADNNGVEDQIRPIAMERNNWLFAGSLRVGGLVAAVLSRLHSARLNGQDPYAYLKNMLQRLPTPPTKRIGELLLHC